MSSARPGNSDHSAILVWLWAGVVVCIALTVLGRVFTPSDIHDKHQWRTISYTADMHQHGRWVMPYDVTGTPATKPPLYNWIAYGTTSLFGFGEFAHKLPSLLSLLVAVAATAGVAYELGKRKQEAQLDADRSPPGTQFEPALPNAAALLAVCSAAVFLANPMTFKLAYLARPDMLLIAAMTSAWWCGEHLLRTAGDAVAASSTRRSWPWALGFWVCVGLAFLAKGPIGWVPVLYVVLASKLVYGNWRRLKPLGWTWGLPLTLALAASWAVPAYLAEPAFFEQRLLGKELGDKSVAADPYGFFNAAYKVPGYFFSRGLPWTLLTLFAVIHIAMHVPKPRRRMLTHPAGSAALFVLVNLGVFLLMVEQRADRFGPTYPAASILACYLLIIGWRKYNLGPRFTLLASIASVLVLISVYEFLMRPATNHYGDDVVEFARKASELVGDDPVRFDSTASTPLQPLMGRNDNGTPVSLEQAVWLVAPIDNEARPELTSKEIAEVYPNAQPGQLMLVRVGETQAARRP